MLDIRYFFVLYYIVENNPSTATCGEKTYIIKISEIKPGFVCYI